MYSNQFMIDNLNRQRERIDDMIKNYQSIPQQAPVNNFINTNQIGTNMYELKHSNEDVENIAILKDTIFIGDETLQIKKLDGTIEKYDIKKTYPRDKKDDKIDELNNKLKEMEMKLNELKTNNEPSEPTKTSTEQAKDVTVNDKPKRAKASK